MIHSVDWLKLHSVIFGPLGAAEQAETQHWHNIDITL